MRCTVVIAVLLLACCAAPGPYSGAREDRELAGRIAGAPQRCVLVQSGEALRVSENDRHVLLYGHGKTVWVTHLAEQCGFSTNDLLVSELLGNYYCRGDMVHSVDRLSRVQGPSCIVGEFVPYTR